MTWATEGGETAQTTRRPLRLDGASVVSACALSPSGEVDPSECGVWLCGLGDRGCGDEVFLEGDGASHGEGAVGSASVVGEVDPA